MKDDEFADRFMKKREDLWKKAAKQLWKHAVAEVVIDLLATRSSITGEDVIAALEARAEALRSPDRAVQDEAITRLRELMTPEPPSG